VSGFGDFDADDAYDPEPADPEQVARKLHRYRLAEGLETVAWDDLDGAAQTVRVLILARLLAWLRRSGSF
jgi:hypothetical protein